MNTLKRFLGYFLLIVLGFITLTVIFRLLKAIVETINEIERDPSYGVGYLIGNIFGFAIIGIIIYFLGKLGFKLINQEDFQSESINEIGRKE